MANRKGARFPWVVQAICILLVGGSIALMAVYGADSTMGLTTPFFVLAIPTIVVTILLVLVSILLPLSVYRRRCRYVRKAKRLCQRCEKPLATEGFALYAGEPVCDVCAEFLEKLEGRKLERYTKGSSENVTS